MKVLSTVFAAILVAFSTLHMANAAYSSQISPLKPNSKQDAMKNMIPAGLQLANQSSQQGRKSTISSMINKHKY